MILRTVNDTLIFEKDKQFQKTIIIINLLRTILQTFLLFLFNTYLDIIINEISKKKSPRGE